VLEILFPQQGQQVVGRVAGQHPGPAHHLEEAHQLVVLHPGPDGEVTHPVLVEHPGEAVVLAGLVVHHLVFPGDVGLDDGQDQLGGGGPDRPEGLPNGLFRPLVDRIVGEVHLERPETLHNGPYQLLHLRGRQREF
jgi:hypothetical protein